MPAISNLVKEHAIKMTTSLMPAPLAQVLQHSAIPALRKLSVEETANAVEISGCVSSYYLKQLAQESILPILGPRKLVNRVTVVRNDPVPARA
jgi:hypothetical protein